MSKQPKILIISFTFPPYSGVGGRRWAKFAKYLRKENIPFHVIASKRLEKTSNWTSDIESYKEHITYVSGGYPLVLTSNPQSIIEKIKYRLALFREKYLSIGNYYDLSKYWKKPLIPCVKEKLEQGFDTVIYTIPPFRGAYFLTELKKEFPNVQFIADFRDPWTSNRTSFGFDSLNQKNLKYEKEMEKEVVHAFDKVLSVSKEINDYLISTHQANPDKFYVLKNGFDIDDKAEPDGKSAKISIAFIGTFYVKAKHLFDEFVQGISELELENPSWFDQMEFNFYGHKPIYFDAGMAKTTSIKHHGMLPLKEAAQQIANAKACMLFLADDTNYSFSTKFYEYVSNNKPVLLFAKAGGTSQFVVENNIGLSFTPGHIKEELSKALPKVIDGSLSFNSNFDTRAFELEQLTKDLLNIITYDS